ncbi:unnamed protein product [Caenorhabditis auriculariae]|uniref:Uncharacterized protein n=1 Tax=Caenorhabditis auriculariae TaxID=2777116 RepID=A0A8S1H0R2_9PELO|nr:unnamed protein product [Caenorhabditis auriculariae]
MLFKTFILLVLLAFVTAEIIPKAERKWFFDKEEGDPCSVISWCGSGLRCTRNPEKMKKPGMFCRVKAPLFYG